MGGKDKGGGGFGGFRLGKRGMEREEEDWEGWGITIGEV
jgi:hypothetical protein